MIAGSARITAVDEEGRSFIDDIQVGDLWHFPAGIPHSIQGLEEGCEFLLVFDDGNFSENETFLITDFLTHIPSEVPGPLDSDRVESPAGEVPVTVSHRLLAQEPLEVAGGRVRIVDSSRFPISKTIAAALVEVDPGGLRELHWHPTTDRTFDYRAGDVGIVPFAMGHYVENTGSEPLRFLELFRSDRFADVSLNQWMALTPPELVKAHLNIDDETAAALSKVKLVIVD